MCNSYNSLYGYNRCACCGATQYICRDACGNIRVNQCGCNTTQSTSNDCGRTESTTTNNTNGCGNGFGFFTVYGRIVNPCAYTTGTTNTENGYGYCARQYGGCRLGCFDSTD